MPAGFGWIASARGWMERASHALVDGGDVWLVDPVDVPGLDARIAEAGRPRAVLRLLARHDRDCARIARRLGVPLLVAPPSVPDAPFEAFAVGGERGSRETALWWPGPRVLVVPETLGTARYYCAPGEALGVHPFARVRRPPAILLRYRPDLLLVGHGPGLHEDVPALIERAVRRARRDLPRTLPRIVTAWRG
ncbi:MAG TPA: hypothetical protein VFB35_02875 [Gaiellaceae bacterium]|nr:hypothetical protein [Gaiellaceae bacterium]